MKRRAMRMWRTSTTLDREPANKPLAWRYGIDETVLDRRVRTAELANWITHQVLPTCGRRRGRA